MAAVGGGGGGGRGASPLQGKDPKRGIIMKYLEMDKGGKWDKKTKEYFFFFWPFFIKQLVCNK